MVAKLLCVATMTLLVSSVCASANLWVKGNLHTHTTQSDGDSPVDVVAKWYKDHGYSFVVITDHNKVANFDSCASLVDGSFIVVTGEEITSAFKGKHVHVNALGNSKAAKPYQSTDVAETIQHNIDAAIDAGGLPMVNHPNFVWAFDHRPMLKTKRLSLLEVYNGHPYVNNAGDAAHISVEQMWDILLSSGMQVYGVADDDAHHFLTFDAAHANPGRGWICVRVKELTQSSVLDGIRRGDFYSSTGVELAGCAFDGKTLRVQVKRSPGVDYVIRFIGMHGQILSEVDGILASYKLSGKPSEAYVRAKVISSDGKVAWTQPVRRKGS